MRSTSFILPALAVVCHGAALPFHIRDVIEAREPQILEPGPTRTVIVGPTPPSWPWTLPPHPNPTWPPKPPKPSSKSSSTKQEPTTWLTYTYPACPQPTQSTPVLTVPIDKREPQTLGWPTRSASVPVASPTKACISQPYATPSRSTSWGGADTTRTIPVITVPISDFAPIPTIEAEAREYTRTIQWEGADTTRRIPPMTVPITARNVEYTRSVDWQGAGTIRTVPVFTVPIEKRQILGEPTRTVIVGPTPDPPAPPTTKPSHTKTTSKSTIKPSHTKTTSKPTSKPTSKSTVKPTSKPTSAPTSKSTSIATSKPTTSTSSKPRPISTEPHPPQTTRLDINEEDETNQKRQEIGIPGYTIVWPSNIPRPTNIPMMTVPVNNKRQELPTGSWPTRTAITWGDSPPGATDLPPIEVPPLDLPPVDVPPVETGVLEEKR